MTPQQGDTPIGTPAASTTPVPVPGTKYPARSAYDEKGSKKLRHGRYSPNGWTICLSCLSPGPVSGLQAVTELVDTGLSGGGPGAASTPPTRIGALSASTATAIWSAASRLASGSMS